MSHTTRLFSVPQARPRVPRFRVVDDRYYEVTDLPWAWMMREPVRVKRHFKTLKPPRRYRAESVVAFLQSSLPRIFFLSIKEEINKFSLSEIVNAAHFNTLQGAVDYAARDLIIHIPPGTYDQNLDIVAGNDNLTLTGHYRGTFIDGGAFAGEPAIDINGADDVTIAFLTVRTTPGGGVGGNEAMLIRDAERLKLVNVFVNGSDHAGIHIHNTSPDCEILDCYIYEVDDQGIHLSTLVARIKIIGCRIQDANGDGILQASDDGTIRGNIINTTGDDGISLPAGADNNVVTDNRITGWTNEPIDNNGYGNDVSHNKTT